MMKHVIKKDHTETVEVTEGSSQWVLKEGVKLTGNPGFQISDFDDVRFDVAGSIIAADHLGISSSSTDNIDVNILSSGSIKASEQAIYVEGSDARVNNKGVLRSLDESAVEIGGDNASIRNWGKIVSAGDAAIDILGGGELKIENHGLLRGANTAISAASTDAGTVLAGTVLNTVGGVIDGGVVFSVVNSMTEMTIINKGNILGVEASGLGLISVVFDDGNDRIVNRGTIEGQIYLQGGADEADLRHGKLKHVIIRGGEGDDVFIIDKTNIHIEESGGEGNDTIQTTVSFTLGNTSSDDIEKLQAIGTKNINLTGNDLGNMVVGNDGNNKLFGGGGDDLLRSDAGNDKLDGGGGGGGDSFEFFIDQGKDIIADFHQDEDDMVLLYFIPGIEDFDDLQARMFESADGTDTIIKLGEGDSITLLDVAKGDLEASDFAIFKEIDLP